MKAIRMSQTRLLPAIDDVLKSIRRKDSIDDVLYLILERACDLARATHGSFVLVDHQARRLTISNVFGSDWSTQTKLCQLEIGQGLTGKAAALGKPLLCTDTRGDPDYYALFSYVRSELVVPVMVQDRVWGVINIDGAQPAAFDKNTLELLIVFAELASSAITLQMEISDQERLYRKLVQSEKLASLGEALAGIAHEINNPLTAILGFSTLLSNALGLSTRDAHTANVIASEAQRAANLVRGLLDFSRKDTGAREMVDAYQLVQKTAGLKRYQLRQNNVKLQVHRPSDTCMIYVCSQQITQVLHNVISNAEQAVSKERRDGLIDVAVSREIDTVKIRITDNGSGIPLEVQPRIFDPFFTTKNPGEGTGLGLSICHTIMAAHEGTIFLAESSNHGTSFVLEFPLPNPVAIQADSAPPFATTEAAVAPYSRILIVDDEPHISEAFAAFLRPRQIEVHCATSARTALELLSREKFDLILSDVRMPEMDGLEFHEAACRRYPRYKQRFIFMSGYLMQPRVKSHLTATGLPCLEKPFSFDELLRTISGHLAVVSPKKEQMIG